MFVHFYLGKGLDNQVGTVCNAMDTHHEQIVFVVELHCHSQLGTLNCGHSIYPNVINKFSLIFRYDKSPYEQATFTIILVGYLLSLPLQFSPK